MRQRSSHHIFGIVLAIVFLLCGVTSFSGCANDANVIINTPKIADSLDIVLGERGGIIALSPDGSRLVVVNSNSLTVYETTSGKIVSEYSNSKSLTQGGVEFGIDSKKLLVFYYGPHSSVLYDISRLQASIITTVPTYSHSHLTDDGKTIIANESRDSTFYIGLYSTNDGSLLKELHPSHYTVPEWGLGYLRDENSIAYIVNDSIPYCNIWNILTDKEERNFKISREIIGVMTFSEEGLTSTFPIDNLVFPIYNTLTGVQSGMIGSGPSGADWEMPHAISKRFFYSAGGNRSVLIYDIAEKKNIQFKIYPEASQHQRLCVSRQENCVAVISNASIRLWRLDLP